MTGTMPMGGVGGSLLASGRVLRYERADDTVEEWFLSQVRDVFAAERVEVVALASRVVLRERVLLVDGTDLTFSGTDTLENVIDAMIATEIWPSWVIRGTVEHNPTISYAWENTDALTALLAAVEAANATDAVTLTGDTLRLVFRRVDASQYAVDVVAAAVAGSPTAIQGKNLTAFATATDRTQQLSAIVPVTSAGAAISEAMFAVRSVSGDTLTVRDWAWRTDTLVVAYDGQWVGWYAVAPDGTTSAVTASSAADRTITVSDATPWGSGDNATVRLTPYVSGAPLIAAVDTAAMALRIGVLSGTWDTRINWAPNSRFDAWSSGTVVEDWTASGGFTLAQSSDEETGDYAVDITYAASAGALTATHVLMPDEVVTNNGGTQTWRAGTRAKIVSGPGGGVQLQRSTDGGGSWSTVGSINNLSYTTIENTFTTTAADLPNRPMLRFARNASSGVVRVDRVWLFRDGVDTGDNTVVGNGACVAFYAAQRAMYRNKVHGYRTYQVGVIDRHRDNPTGFPNDNLLVNQEARVVVPSRSVDVTLPIASLEVDELRHQKTNAQFGAPKRRLADLL